LWGCAHIWGLAAFVINSGPAMAATEEHLCRGMMVAIKVLKIRSPHHILPVSFNLFILPTIPLFSKTFNSSRNHQNGR
jgi:hypothetical protein